MMGFDMFDIMGTLFPIVFIAFGVIFFIIIVRGIAQYSHNNAQPKVPAEAIVVAKRTSVSNHHHNTGTVDASITNTTTRTSYYITFEFAAGDRQEFHVPSREYGLIAEGDSGILTSQGTRFISFERSLQEEAGQ